MQQRSAAPVDPRLAMLVAVFFISTAAILVRWSDASPNVIAFYRVFLAAGFLFLIRPAGTVRELRSVGRRQVFQTAWAGLFLAVHFGTWIAALNYTTIANAVTLVDSAPIFALLMSHFILGESSRPASFAGVLLTVAGAVIIGWGDFSTDPRYFTGDILALIGAVSAAGYMVIGRSVRAKIDLNGYLVMVYGFAALFLGFWCLLLDVSFFGYSVRNYMIFAALAVLPTIGGHSLFLYALRYMKAFVVNLGFLGEPIGAAILAAIIFKEYPPWYFYPGGFLIIAGTVIALVYEGMKERGK